MRIGLTSTVFNKQGGIARYVVELAERFVEHHQVHILTSRYESHIEGAIVHEDPILWSPISLQVASNALKNISAIKRLRKSGIDVINSQGADALNSDVVTMHSCQKAAVKIIGGEKGLSYTILKSLEPRSNIVLVIEKHVLNHSKKIIAVSNSVKKDLVREYRIPEGKIEVIHNGVNLEEFNPDNKKKYRTALRKQHGFDENDTVLMFSGREFKRKGLRYVIEALPELRKNVKLLVVGGADKSEYEALSNRLGVKDRVMFVGHRNNISEYYSASDAFILPTAYEPFGLVITEAMASGLPVVATRTSGAAELITDGTDGMLLESPYDAREVAEKVRYVLDNNLADGMGSRARKTVEKYSWNSAAEKTLAVYESVKRG